jgi:hypothetical protein
MFDSQEPNSYSFARSSVSSMSQRFLFLKVPNVSDLSFAYAPQIAFARYKIRRQKLPFALIASEETN